MPFNLFEAKNQTEITSRLIFLFLPPKDGPVTRFDTCYSYDFASNAWKVQGRMPEVKAKVGIVYP